MEQTRLAGNSSDPIHSRLAWLLLLTSAIMVILNIRDAVSLYAFPPMEWMVKIGSPALMIGFVIVIVTYPLRYARLALSAVLATLLIRYLLRYFGASDSRWRWLIAALWVGGEIASIANVMALRGSPEKTGSPDG